MVPVEPWSEESNPDTTVFNVTQWTQMFFLEELWYVVVKVGENAIPTTAPVSYGPVA